MATPATRLAIRRPAAPSSRRCTVPSHYKAKLTTVCPREDSPTSHLGGHEGVLRSVPCQTPLGKGGEMLRWVAR